MVSVKPVKFGNNVRMSFSKINEVLDMPNLIEIQKDSYRWFLDEGLREVFADFSSVSDFSHNLVLSFLDYRLDDKPKYSVNECKERETTYAAPMRVRARLVNKETGEIKESEVFIGDFPLMTESGTFVINGAERVVVSQLVRSPGAYYDVEIDKSGRRLYNATIIPNRGAWLEFETDQNEILYVRIDKTRKIPISTLMRSFGVFTGTAMSNEEMIALLGEDARFNLTLEKDTSADVDGALLEVYKKLRPGEPFTVDGAKGYIYNLFFDPRRYDMSRVGRYKYNKKLSLAPRIIGRAAARPVVAPLTGEILAEPDHVITKAEAAAMEAAGVNEVYINVADPEGNVTEVKVLSNGMVELSDFVSPAVYEAVRDVVNEKVDFQLLQMILEEAKDEETLKQSLIGAATELIPNHITLNDIFAAVNYFFGLPHGVGHIDDIDHLGNRRIRCVGELLQNQFRIGFSRMERVIREKMSLQSQDTDVITPQSLINIRPIVAAIKEFFGSSQLSQFMDQTNPLAELTHKRRLSALGPGGLSRDRAGFEVRDVHYSHYGRMCPIETPEGPNIGLISYLATYARINRYGFIEAPFRKVLVDDEGRHYVSDIVEYMTADAEDEFVVAQANTPLDEKGYFINNLVTARCRDQFLETTADNVNYMDVSPKMVVSVATAMIPFLENDDTNRALMGSNMQKQAVPLLKPEAPIVGTGMEYKAAIDSGVVVLAKRAGTVKSVSADVIEITAENGEVDEYKLIKFLRSNHSPASTRVQSSTSGSRSSPARSSPTAPPPATARSPSARTP